MLVEVLDYGTHVWLLDFILWLSAPKMVSEEAVENPFFFSCLEIMVMRAVGTISIQMALL